MEKLFLFIFFFEEGRVREICSQPVQPKSDARWSKKILCEIDVTKQEKIYKTIQSLRTINDKIPN